MEPVVALAAPYLGRFAAYPNVLERLNLVITNGLFMGLLFIIIGSIWFLAPSKRSLLLRCSACLMIGMVWLVRTVFDYAYDQPIAIIAWVVDAGLLSWLAYKLSSRLFPKVSDKSTQWALGLAVASYLATLAIGLNLNPQLYQLPSIAIHLAVSAMLCREIWRFEIRQLKPLHILPLALAALPFVPHVFSPAPPDADIATQVEMTGYLLQGQDLNKVTSGYRDELYSLRYPAGFSSLSYISAYLLNVRGSESALLLWLLGMPLIILGLMQICRQLEVPAWIAAVLALNISLTGINALGGGQAQEALAYGFGLFAIAQLMGGHLVAAALLIMAAALHQPIVSLPFGFVAAVTFLLRIQQWQRKTLIATTLLAAPFLTYMILTITGASIEDTEASQLWQGITPQLFFATGFKFMHLDSFGLWPLHLLSIILAWKFIQWRVIVFWLLGAFAADGVFSVVFPWVGGRQISSYATIGPLIIVSAWAGYQIWLRLVNIPLELPRQPWIAAGLLLATWWAAIGQPLPLRPESVFTSHANIRLGRIVEKQLEPGSLIMNIRPPGDPNPHDGYGFHVRGDSLHHAVNARIGTGHQIKNGVVYSMTEKNGCSKQPLGEYFSCLKGLGITHLWVDGRPGTERYLAETDAIPQYTVGASRLYQLQ